MLFKFKSVNLHHHSDYVYTAEVLKSEILELKISQFDNLLRITPVKEDVRYVFFPLAKLCNLRKIAM